MQSAVAGEWIVDAKGCKAWNHSPVAGESILWDGACEEGYVNGEGVLQWFKDGKLIEKHTGNFKKGYLSGKGELVVTNGYRYEGDYVNSQRTGKGVLILANGDRYEGGFVEGKFHGKGVYTWKDGDRYAGDFVLGKRTGKGVVLWPSGARYEGDFVDGKQHGKGVYVFSNGNRYEGDFVKGAFTGKGVYTWKDGDRYKGDFVGDKRTGKGELIDSSGDRYEGDFVDGTRHGKGVYIFTNGNRYEGDFVNGDFTGMGVYTWKNGNRYEGDFVGDKPNGFGELRVSERDYVEEERSDKGRWTTSLFGFKIFIEQGLFKDGVLVLACTDKYDCENKKLEPYRAAFRNASSSSELSSFIEEYQDNDPDKLVPKARQKIPAAQKREREQERLAAAKRVKEERAAAVKRAQEERAAYRAAFRNASSSSELSDFVSKYAGNDPEKLVPKARQKMAAAQKREREQRAREERAAKTYSNSVNMQEQNNVSYSKSAYFPATTYSTAYTTLNCKLGGRSARAHVNEWTSGAITYYTPAKDSWVGSAKYSFEEAAIEACKYAL